MASVCILNQTSGGVIDEAKLLQENLKIRRAASSVPDIIFSGSGTTAAFLLLRGAAELASKVDKLCKTFKFAYVLIPHPLLADANVTTAVCGLAADEVTFVHMPAGADFTAVAINLSKSVFRAAAHEKQWRLEQGQAVQQAEAIDSILAGLPMTRAADPVHITSMLRMLGSLQQLSQCTGQQIAAQTDLDIDSSTAITDFFQSRR